MQQRTGQIVLYRSYTRASATNLRCSKVLQHVFTLSSKCLEPRTLTVSCDLSGDPNRMDASGWSISVTVAFSATYPKSLQGDHTMCLYERGASANAAAAGKFVWRRVTAGNLVTTVVTLLTTRNKFKLVHRPVYMTDLCNHVSCQHLNHVQCVSGLYKDVFLVWMDSDGTCGYNLINELFII